MAVGEAFLKQARVFDPHSGEWIHEKFQHIAEIINDLNPNLFLVWIPESMRTDTDLTPYGVMHRQPDGSEYIFMYIKENELDERVIAQIMESRSDNLLQKLEHMENAKKLVELKEQAERMEDVHDRALSMWRSPLHTYRYNGKKLRQ